MKRFLLCCVGLLFIGTTQTQAQNKNTSKQNHQVLESNQQYELVATTDLSWIRVPGQRNTGFPWNGCAEFVVTVDLEFVQIETVIVVCCVEGICIPNMQLPTQIDLTDNQQIQIQHSSSEQVGNHQISIRPGPYTVDKEGRLQNLTYLVRTAK